MTPRKQFKDEHTALAELRQALRDRAAAAYLFGTAPSAYMKDAMLALSDAELRVVNARCALDALLLEDA